MSDRNGDIAVIGAGIVGIACAYYLAKGRASSKIVIIDPRAPMSLTSAASGENYRNWWPHPIMTAFTDYSIDLLEEISREHDSRIHMSRRGYALATREARPEQLLRELQTGYGPEGAPRIRVHEGASAPSYTPPVSADWRDAPEGVDVLQNRHLIRRHFPTFDPEVSTILHIRRAGDISGQQLGSLMLEQIRAKGGILAPARVTEIARQQDGFVVTARGPDGEDKIRAAIVVNAAGPYVADIARMLGESLPVENIFHQKIAFADNLGAIDRRMPFSIDLDGQAIDWTNQERQLIEEDPATAWLARPMPGGIHCRPEGGDLGKWIKLGWAYNRTPSEPRDDLPTDPNFPDIVLRGASRLNPRLKQYYGRLPRQITHYGGYYTMTKENWPLIGPMKTKHAYVAGAMSGFGTMAACATGALCAGWVLGKRPEFAERLSLSRYNDEIFVRQLRESASRGVL
ncbi:Glycine/D-amino acid oxidase [Bradyrhizobium sp. Rc3b]|uniref:NAD(P)/FAD-dependent oxidoreductase n=1 Tax=Bradyrhizobium sp. Rc3b TaxID=1855322 RepID=UPI0008E8B83D|nr:FAD-dependent oxidoreductase [Bradyrhizobium sp. Rc3b]SFN78550.1 Glycine/D-amino acid oxidase [Bradyrhizobium sp. Rc3b]